MALTLSYEQTNEFKSIPAGSYHAVCVRLIDLGTQEVNYQNEVKQQHKINITWEIIPDPNDPETVMSDGRPFVVNKRFTASLHEKSQLRQTLKSWRGRDFTDEELRGFDMQNILGAPCLISLSEVEKDGKIYTNVASVGKKMAGAVLPEQTHNPAASFDLDAPDWSVFESLSNHIQEIIKKSPEYGKLSAPIPEMPAPPKREDATQANSVDDLDDDIPF